MPETYINNVLTQRKHISGVANLWLFAWFLVAHGITRSPTKYVTINDL